MILSQIYSFLLCKFIKCLFHKKVQSKSKKTWPGEDQVPEPCGFAAKPFSSPFKRFLISRYVEVDVQAPNADQENALACLFAHIWFI